MLLKIKTLKGDSFSIQIEESASFLDVKNVIKGLRGLGVETQKIVYKGKAMEDGAILAEVGVRDEDNLVLMHIFQKKINPNTQKKEVKVAQVDQKKKEYKGKQSDPDFQKKIDQIVGMGFTPDQSSQALIAAKGQTDQAIIKLTKDGGGSTEANTLIKQQIFKALKQNQQLLEQGNLFEGANVDIESIANMIGDKNEELKKMLLENPEALNELLFQNMDDDGDDLDDSSPEMQELELTEAEEQSIQKLMNLGFTRENVIQVFFACDKDEDLAANMLFDQRNSEEGEGEQ